MEMQRKKQAQIHKNVFTMTSGGFEIAVRNDSFIDSKEHGLQTPNEDINQRYLKNWADVADKKCFSCT
jgi:hypothetical protein